MLQKKVIEILKENERIDDLQINNLKIIQNNNGFCFGMDSVILSEFAKDIKKNSKIIDLGTGTGILGFLLIAKNKPKNIIGIEVQEEVADMAKRSIELNNLTHIFNILNCNVKDISKNIEINSYDAVITNPPYKKLDTGGKNENQKKLISRHEVLGNLKDFIISAKIALKDKGSLYMVHRPERLGDIIFTLKQNRFEPKRIRFVYSDINSSEAKLVLIKAVKNGGEFLRVEKPLFIYDNNGEYTEEIKQIYNNN